MSQYTVDCLANLENVRSAAFDNYSCLDLDEIDQIHHRISSLATEINILRAWKHTVTALESDEGYHRCIKHLHGYLKFLFGDQKGNKKRQEVIEELKSGDVFTTLIIGLSSLLDVRDINPSILKAITNVQPIITAQRNFLPILQREHIRKGILVEINDFDEATNRWGKSELASGHGIASRLQRQTLSYCFGFQTSRDTRSVVELKMMNKRNLHDPISTTIMIFPFQQATSQSHSHMMTKRKRTSNQAKV
jgi:hypothetical protein